MVPLTPSGLMHGTRVQLLPDGHEKKAVSVRPAEAKQQGLTVGVDNQVNYRGEDRSELCAADVLDIGFLIGILDGHCGGQCASHVANGFPKILHDVYGFEVNQTRGVDTLSCARETELLRDVLRSSCRAAERDLMLTASKGHWTDGTSAMFALLAHGFDEEGAPVTVPGTKGVAKVFLASRCALPGTAWCGDTRALLLHGRKVVPLSEDHVPKRKDEYNRVKAAGGKVLDFDGKLKAPGPSSREGPPPVSDAEGAYKDLVWLETTRSFGDIRLKAPHNIAPRVHGNLAPEDWALVLVSSKAMRSHPVTAKMSNQDIAEVCKEYFSQGKDAVAASQALTTAARKRGATGNLTTVVMRFGWPPGCNGDDTGKVGWREGSGAACLGELFEFLGVCLGVGVLECDSYRSYSLLCSYRSTKHRGTISR
ncbi:Protein phosphatase 2C 53 (OsPP2C53) (ABI1-like protein 2) (OsABI-LIKE2) (OsABIL2) [Durusdinium trenchii]|uniref:Protein phosphatase 2C 53 (OsPP2C53) (ABI1-like protein 2) (OsABI-LIKE2) (OsABIL2) n=1 Tax=Durusdinium trenchii TaxID=1381693 RepID=A0ABP0ILA7_9DINO